MNLVGAHLEQIELCSSTIAELPFPRPRLFTNAMLHAPDITALIRDTEAHERALFSLAKRAETSSAREPLSNPARRSTVFSLQDEQQNKEQTFKAPRRGTAVAAVLGGDLSHQVRRELSRDFKDTTRGRTKQVDEIDVDVLLKGAERLCGVYSIAGASEKIACLRNRNAKALAFIQEYDGLVAEQATLLGKMNMSSSLVMDDNEADEIALRETTNSDLHQTDHPLTEEELKREEEACNELERKKRSLEERVNGMERDLGGLLR